MTVVKEVDFGVYLDGGDEGEILLPKRYVPEGLRPGDEIEVFLYLDQEERLIATTERPLAKVGDFAYLEVKWVNEYGAFLGWGLMKDLFCPFREQKMRMQVGKSYIVYVRIDEESYRIVATAKIDKYFDFSFPQYQHGEEVDLLVWQKTDLGFKAIIDNRFQGLLYQDQIFQYVHAGDRLKGYIDKVRPDGKIDVTLQPTRRHLRPLPREQEGVQASHRRPIQAEAHPGEPPQHTVGVRRASTAPLRPWSCSPGRDCPCSLSRQSPPRSPSVTSARGR